MLPNVGLVRALYLWLLTDDAAGEAGKQSADNMTTAQKQHAAAAAGRVSRSE